MDKIKQIAVIGSGVMGASIAAHIANSGFKVMLFDITPKGAVENNILVKNAISKLHKINALASPYIADLIIPLSLDFDLDKIAQADLIIEAIVENLEIKQNLYKKLERIVKKDAIISSNTSTLPMSKLLINQSENFKKHFLITHFFNPPRHMRLLELVVNPHTDLKVTERIKHFCDHKLGKIIVEGKDTPGFIANRIGCYFLEVGLQEAIRLGIKPEIADSIFSKPMGIPNTGIFGLIDLIGLDVIGLIANSFLNSLDEADDFRIIHKPNALIDNMVKENYIGKKGKGGFYIYKEIEGKKTKLSKNLITGDYAPLEDVSNYLKLSINEIIKLPVAIGQFARSVLQKTLSYTARLSYEIANDIYQIDQAMRTGYNWKFGPFELIDQIDKDWILENLKNIPIIENYPKDGFYKDNKFYHHSKYEPINEPQGIIKLADKKIILENQDAAIYDLANNIHAFTLKTKMNSLTSDAFHLMAQAIELGSKALVITSTIDNFCVGANLKIFLELAKEENWDEIEQFVKLGQDTMMQIKYSKIPVIAAPLGFALGGGCELLLHSHFIQAHIETYAGLVETSVGLIPGWGGTKEMIMRAKNENDLLDKFKLIINAIKSSSAQDFANSYGLNNIKITMNKDRIFSEAFEFAKNLDFTPLTYKKTNLKTDKATLQKAIDECELENHDLLIANALIEIFTYGGSEQELLDLERKIFMNLIKTKQTQDRIEYILANGKALKN